MIKNILFIGLMAFKSYYFSQNFTAVYNFSNVTTNTGLTDPGPSPLVSGLLFGNFSSVGTSTNANASGRFSFTKWPVGAADSDDNYGNFIAVLSPTVFYEVKIKVMPSYTMSLNSISFAVRRSGTGIRNYCVRSSLDNFTNNLAASTGTNTKLSVIPANVFFWNFDSISTSTDQKGSSLFLGSPFSSVNDSLRFRFYAWNSESSGGTFSIDNVTFEGSVKDTNVILNPVSIEELNFRETGNNSDMLKVQPNPSYDGRILIKTPHDYTKIEISALLGLKVELEHHISSQQAIELDLSALKPGMYVIKFYSGSKVSYAKLILAHT